MPGHDGVIQCERVPHYSLDPDAQILWPGVIRGVFVTSITGASGLTPMPRRRRRVVWLVLH